MHVAFKNLMLQSCMLPLLSTSHHFTPHSPSIKPHTPYHSIPTHLIASIINKKTFLTNMATTMTKLILAAIMAIMVATPHTSEAAITCGTVTQKVIPCLSYLRNMGPLTQGCCNGVTALNQAAQSTPDRQAACNCLKQAASAISGISTANAAALPGKCGVNIPYKISTSTNCASVK